MKVTKLINLVISKVIKHFIEAIDLFDRINGWSEVKKITKKKKKNKDRIKIQKLNFISDFRSTFGKIRYKVYQEIYQKIKLWENKKFQFISLLKLHFYWYLWKLEEYNKKLHDIIFFFLFLLYNVMYCLLISLKYNFLILLKIANFIYLINKYIFVTNPVCWFLWRYLYQMIFFLSSFYLFRNSWFGKWFNDWEWYNFFQYNWNNIYSNYQEYPNDVLGCYFLLKYYFPSEYLDRLEEEDNNLYWEIDEKYTYEYFSLEKKFSIFFNNIKNYAKQTYYKYYNQFLENIYRLIKNEDLQHYTNSLESYWKYAPEEGSLNWDIFHLSEHIWWNNHFKQLNQYNTFFITPKYAEQKLMIELWENLLYNYPKGDVWTRAEVIKHNMTWQEYLKWYDGYQGRSYFNDLYLPYAESNYYLLSFYAPFFWKKAKEHKKFGKWMIDTYYENILKEHFKESLAFKKSHLFFWKDPQWNLKDYVYYNKLQYTSIEKINLLYKLKYNMEYYHFKKFYYEDNVFEMSGFFLDRNYLFDKYLNNNRDLYLRFRRLIIDKTKEKHTTVKYENNGTLYNTAELDFNAKYPISNDKDECSELVRDYLKKHPSSGEKKYIDLYENLKQLEFSSHEFLINNYHYLKYLVIYPESLVLVYILFIISFFIISDIYFHSNFFLSFLEKIIKKIIIIYYYCFYYIYTKTTVYRAFINFYIIIYYKKYFSKLKNFYNKSKTNLFWLYEKLHLISKKIADFIVYINSNKYIQKFHLIIGKIIDWFRDEKPPKEELKYKLLKEKLKKENIGKGE